MTKLSNEISYIMYFLDVKDYYLLTAIIYLADKLHLIRYDRLVSHKKYICTPYGVRIKDIHCTFIYTNYNTQDFSASDFECINSAYKIIMSGGVLDEVLQDSIWYEFYDFYSLKINQDISLDTIKKLLVNDRLVWSYLNNGNVESG